MEVMLVIAGRLPEIYKISQIFNETKNIFVWPQLTKDRQSLLILKPMTTMGGGGYWDTTYSKAQVFLPFRSYLIFFLNGQGLFTEIGQFR